MHETIPRLCELLVNIKGRFRQKLEPILAILDSVPRTAMFTSDDVTELGLLGIVVTYEWFTQNYPNEHLLQDTESTTVMS